MLVGVGVPAIDVRIDCRSLVNSLLPSIKIRYTIGILSKKTEGTATATSFIAISTKVKPAEECRKELELEAIDTRWDTWVRGAAEVDGVPRR